MKHASRWIVWESKNIFKNRMDIDKFFSRINTKKFIEEISITDFEEIRKQYKDKSNKDSEIFGEYGVVVEEKQTVLYFKYNGKAYSLGMPRLSSEKMVDTRETEIVEKELFWEVFGRYSASRPWIRLIILILLLISGLLFAIVFCQNIIKGLTYAMG